MSSSRSLRPWPRRCTTPHVDRGRPGPGRRRATWSTRRRSGRLLFPSLCSSACTKKSPTGKAAGATRTDSAAHRGAHTGDVCACSVSRRSCGADGGPAGGSAQATRHRGTRAGDRSAQDHSPRRHPAARSATVPQMAEQLVDEPVPSFDDIELVEEEEEEEEEAQPRMVPGSRVRDAHGRSWCQVAGLGVYWWMIGTSTSGPPPLK